MPRKSPTVDELIADLRLEANEQAGAGCTDVRHLRAAARKLKQLQGEVREAWADADKQNDALSIELAKNERLAGEVLTLRKENDSLRLEAIPEDVVLRTCKCPDCGAGASDIRTDTFTTGRPGYARKFTCTRCGWQRVINT